jgi:hypothetical protein
VSARGREAGLPAPGGLEAGHQVGDAERGIGVQDVGGRFSRAPGTGQDLPCGAPGHHQLVGETGVQRGESGKVAIPDGAFHRVIKGNRPLVQVTGGGHVAPGTAIPHHQHDRPGPGADPAPGDYLTPGAAPGGFTSGGPVRGGRERRAEPDAPGRGLALPDRLNDPGTRVSGLVQEQGGEPDRQREIRLAAVLQGGGEGGQAQPGSGVPVRRRGGGADHDDLAGRVPDEPADGFRAGRAQLGYDGITAGQLAGEQGRVRAQHSTGDHRGNSRAGIVYVSPLIVRAG